MLLYIPLHATCFSWLDAMFENMLDADIEIIPKITMQILIKLCVQSTVVLNRLIISNAARISLKLFHMQIKFALLDILLSRQSSR